MVARHAQPAELHDHVFARSEFHHVPLPLGQDFLAPVGKALAANGRTEVIHHHHRSRGGFGHVGKTTVLIVVVPRLVDEAHLAE